MIAWTICVIIVIAIAATIYVTRRLVHHPGDRHHPLPPDARPKPATEPATIPRRDVAGAPPWNPAAGWAGGHAPDPETARLVWLAEHPEPVIWTADKDVSDEEMAAFREAFRDAIKEEMSCASGNGHVTAAEPLAPLPPADWPAAPPASAPASARSAACTGPASAPATPAPLAAEPAPWIADLEAAGYDAHGGDLAAIAESCWTKGMGAELREALAVNGDG